MSLPSIFNYMNTALIELHINEMLQSNYESIKYGLMLTAEDALEIIEARNNVLQGYGRVELDMEVTKKLIRHFCTSPFIHQEDYSSTIQALQEIFYYVKNETEDKIGDDDLISIIGDYFNNSCGGSLELLQGRELEEFAKDVRRNSQLDEYPLEEEEY